MTGWRAAGGCWTSDAVTAAAGTPLGGGRSRRALAGLDLSAEELALARRRPHVARADLRVGAGAATPFEDGRFDGCVSHMALMLMSDAEQVAAELARVLEPGGTLAVVVGGGAAGGEAYASFLRLPCR